jgi:transposase
MANSLTSKTLDHLGLVSAMCEELDLVAQIDKHFPQDLQRREVSIGTICKALILNGLGFVERRLYMVSNFFEDKPIELLLGQGVAAEHLNDTVIGRALDELQAYGCTKLFSQLVPTVCEKLSLNSRFAHLDSTSFHLDGTYNSATPPPEEAQTLHLTQGYSRDYHPELNQVVLNLITDNQAGIPLHMQALSGNTNDKSSFRATIENHVSQLQNVTDIAYLIVDSAGYTRKTLQAYPNGLKWVSRVPATLKACKEAIGADLVFEHLTEGYQYASLCSAYGDVQQRWLVIHSEQASKKQRKTLLKNHCKQSKQEYKQVLAFEKQEFACKADAQRALTALMDKMKTLALEEVEWEEKVHYKGKGRPKKDAPVERIGYLARLTVSCSIARFEAEAKRRGMFILATNELDAQKLEDVEVLRAYKRQSKVERGFRFLKDPQFVASNFFVKKPERVEALVFIMTLCLTVYAAIEYRIRQLLLLRSVFLPNQLGKAVQNPTARWIFELFRGIHILYGMDKVLVLNLKDVHRKVLELLGEEYEKYYLQ